MNKLDQGMLNAAGVCLLTFSVLAVFCLLLGCGPREGDLHSRLNAKIDECNAAGKQVVLVAEDGGMPTAVICPADAQK